MRLSPVGLALLLLVAVPCLAEPPECADEGIDSVLVLMTWNVQGYPEGTEVKRELFSTAIGGIGAHVLCVQEIKGIGVVKDFVTNEVGYTQYAFTDDRSEGKDNAIFAFSDVSMDDGRVSDPAGFQFEAKAVYVAYGGFDAVLITVHLSYKDTDKRKEEWALLADFVNQALEIDPDVIVAGDVNTKGKEDWDTIENLAMTLGLQILSPVGPNATPTNYGQSPHWFDHILVSSDLFTEEAIAGYTVLFADTGTATDVSDHRPVVALFRTDPEYCDREVE
ncbi:endonuclease/exonuclease/phosphatase family protein [Candidatus Bipolaricaulota bacterium]|nr:endonuclease/exonuclease/phosphatase family protein [Candidatus Bipolaricaulota bacterium]